MFKAVSVLLVFAVAISSWNDAKKQVATLRAKLIVLDERLVSERTATNGLREHLDAATVSLVAREHDLARQKLLSESLAKECGELTKTVVFVKNQLASAEAKRPRNVTLNIRCEHSAECADQYAVQLAKQFGKGMAGQHASVTVNH